MVLGELCGKIGAQSLKLAAGDQTGHLGFVYALIVVTKQM